LGSSPTSGIGEDVTDVLLHARVRIWPDADDFVPCNKSSAIWGTPDVLADAAATAALEEARYRVGIGQRNCNRRGLRQGVSAAVAKVTNKSKFAAAGSCSLPFHGSWFHRHSESFGAAQARHSVPSASNARPFSTGSLMQQARHGLSQRSRHSGSLSSCWLGWSPWKPATISP
jgi:hypothetical protein